MKKYCIVTILLVAIASLATFQLCRADDGLATDSIAAVEAVVADTIVAPEPVLSYERLTEEDYAEVAREMGVEVAAIKAVVDIEAGPEQKGFWEPGKPLINFDLSMYRKFAPKRGVNLSAARKKFPVIFNSPNTKKYGSKQAAQYARFEAAEQLNVESAIEGAFWGMFQIGGFNYKLCGFDTPQEFLEMMSRSERDQLEIFARFCESRGLTKYIREKNWAAFAQRYNGNSYKSRRYDTKMRNAYNKYK